MITKRFLLAALASLLIWMPAAGPVFAETQDQSGNGQARWHEVYEILLEHHVSAPDGDDLAEAAIEGMIESLNDPYTEYFTPEELENFQNSVNQTYVGVGIQLGVSEDRFYVDRVFEGSPAAESKVLPGDTIAEIDGKSIEGWELEQVSGAIRGQEGTKVKLTLLRGGRRIEVELTRRQVTIPAVSVKRLDGRTAYVQLTTFSQDAGMKMREVLQELEKEGLEALVLDLRDNPGGYLQTAREIAAMFIDRGELMLTKNRDGVQRPLLIFGGRDPDYQVVVLVNGNSASASEVLAGALQDHQAAVLVGEKTFGKGSVQSLVKLESGGALKVTIEEYYTPAGHPVNGVGITPDVPVSGRISQLLMALHQTGAGSLNVRIRANSTRIQEAEFSDVVPVIQENGNVYVPSRVLAAMVGEPVAWDASAQAAVIGSGEETVAFRAGTVRAKLVQGISFIELDAFRQAYPAFSWEADEDGIRMTVTKER